MGQTFTLDGSGSYDPDNGPQPLTYKWVQTSGPVDTSADGATTADASFSTTTAGTYDFTLTVSDGQLTDSASTAVTVTPAQVTGLSASAVDPNTGDFTLSWSPAQGATSYSVEQSENGGGYSLLSQTYSGTSAALTGYGNGNYSFAVQGCGNNTCGAFSSAVSVSVLRIPAVPAAPSLSPNPSSTGSYTVSWSAVSGASSYALYSSTDGSTYSSTNVGSATSQSETVSSSGTYYYKVAACNASGCSATSSATTETVAFPIPGAPVLSPSSQTISSGGTASVSWQPQGPAATSYTLQGKAASGSWSTAYTGTATSFSQTLTGGVAGLHYYQVEACNSYGCSAWSNTVSVTIQSNTCRTCSPVNATQTTAPSGSSTAPTTAPSASSSTPPASAGGLTMSGLGAAGSSATMQLARASLPGSTHSAAPSPVPALALLRQQALHIEALRIAEQPAHTALPPQPLYAAEVETPAGLLSAQQAVALGLLNPHRLSDHTERTTAGTSRYQVNYVYDAHGNLTEVVDAANPNLIYWTATAGNAFGQVTEELLGNGVTNSYGFDPNTGALTTLLSGPGTNPTLANWAYQWDQDGNLSQRSDKNANLTEKFTYDSLNRLTEADVSGASTSSQSFSYDAVGDLKTRTGVGTYNYNSSPQPPMQIASITAPNGTTRSFSYDADGNTLSDGLHSYTWDALNRATVIQDGATGGSEQIAYTPDGARYLETTTLNSTSSTLAEVTPLFEVEASASYIYYRETIVGGTGPVAIRSIRNDGTLTTRYLSGDHLGSVSIITNEIGGEVEAMSYGPFGERRDPGTWQPYGTSPNLTDITDKGYTGQQMLDAVGLIHMNGRVYDPELGRMISADPTVPDPLDSQSFNRYAYVENNPLSAIDPSGFTSTNSCNGTGSSKQQDGSGSSGCPLPPPETGSHISGVNTGATCQGDCLGWGPMGPGTGNSNNNGSNNAPDSTGGPGTVNLGLIRCNLSAGCGDQIAAAVEAYFEGQLALQMLNGTNWLGPGGVVGSPGSPTTLSIWPILDIGNKVNTDVSNGIGLSKEILNLGIEKSISAGVPVAQFDTDLKMIDGLKNLSKLSKGLLVAGTLAGGALAYEDYKKGDYVGMTQAGIGVAEGVAGEYGGPVGLGLAVGYDALTQSGAADAIGSWLTDWNFLYNTEPASPKP